MPAPPLIFQACLIVDGNVGRPQSDIIPHQQLEYLIKAQFTVPMIAKLVGVFCEHHSTLNARVHAHEAQDHPITAQLVPLTSQLM